MADYVLYLGPSPPFALYERIASIAPDIPQSINHAPYFPLRHRTITVSVETKTLSGTEEEARVQLGA